MVIVRAICSLPGLFGEHAKLAVEAVIAAISVTKAIERLIWQKILSVAANRGHDRYN